MSDLIKTYASQEEIPGWSTTGKNYSYDGVSYVAKEGAVSLNHKEYNYSAGQCAVAEGFNTKAFGDYSHAEGRYTIALGEGQHVEGKYNIQDTTSVHIVGNGTSTYNRSNAYTVSREGDGWFSGDVYTGSTSGTNKDEGSKKLATEDYVNESLSGIDGGSQVFIQENEPTDAQEGDFWVDPNSGTSSVLVAIENGGTGAASAAEARTNLNVYSKEEVQAYIAQQIANIADYSAEVF